MPKLSSRQQTSVQPESGLLADLPPNSELAADSRQVQPIRTLLVEDGEIDAVIVRSNLDQTASGDFALDHAVTLEAAHKHLKTHDDTQVVILDLNLPDSEGIATFESLNSAFPSIPIVILTGQDDVDTASSAVAGGAQDFVPKSQLTPETLTRSLHYAIERQARRSAERKNQRIQAELEAARNIQQMMLPQGPPTIPGLDVAATCMPAEVCGGDFFDYFVGKDGKWDFVIGDVSSHGFGPALITVGARRALRMSSRLYDDVGEILSFANQGISEDTAGNHFITLFYARLEPATRTFSYTSAGHPVWIVTSDGAVVSLRCEGLPLGILPDMEYETVEAIQLSPGDTVVMPTDGLYEAMNDAGQLFGARELLELVVQSRHLSAEEIRDKVIDHILQYCHPHGPHDDLTLMLAKCI